MRARQAGKIAVLVIDEAHKLAPVVLEEVRLLSNLELPGEKLLQIVLAGQDELLELLGRPEMRQISQRISIRLTLSPLAPADIEQYIALRWSKSGARAAAPFAPEAYAEIALWSRGIPRLVNALCDNAIMTAFSGNPPVVASRHVREAARDLGLMPAAMARPPHATARAQRGFPEAVRGKDEQSPPRVAVAPRRVPNSEEHANTPRLSRWMIRLGWSTGSTMSKIFEALQGAPKRSIGSCRFVLMRDDSTSGPPPISATGPAAAAHAAAPPPVTEMERGDWIGHGNGIRKVRLAIPVSCPSVLPFEDAGGLAAEQYRIARTKLGIIPKSRG